MRQATATLLGLAAVIGMAIAAPAVWATHNVVDEDGYVELVAPLAEDPDFQSEVADAVAGQLVPDLPAASQLVAGVIESLTAKIGSLNGYQEAWEEMQRRSHRLVFAADEPRLAIDLAPLADLVVGEVNDVSPIDLRSPERIVVDMDTSITTSQLEALRGMPPKASALTGLVAVLAIGCVALSRRRARAVGLLGLGATLAAGAVKVAADERIGHAVAMEASGQGGRLEELLVVTVTRSLDHWLLVLAGAGIVLFVVGVAAQAIFKGGARENQVRS